jgi:Flp pilus assembly protein TadG
VEFSLTASVFFMTLIGLMKVCLAIYTYHYISEAAREGSRYAMVRGATCAVSGVSCATATDGSGVQTFVKGLGYPGISTSGMTVTTTWSAYPSTGTCSPSTSCNNPGNLVKVKISYAFPLSIPFRTTTTYTMNSTSAILISQ